MGREPGQSWGAPSAHPSSAQAAILTPLTALIPPGMEPSCSFCPWTDWDWLSWSEHGAENNKVVGSVPEDAQPLLELDLMSLVGRFQLTIFCEGFDQVQDYLSIAVFFKYFEGTSSNKVC